MDGWMETKVVLRHCYPKSKNQIVCLINLLESGLELLGNGSVVLWLPHDFTDKTLLAVQVVVVELFIEILEH